MSHFAVLVIRTKNQELKSVLQPFHEFECTGTDDQYVVDHDITDEARDGYQTATSLQLEDQDGARHYAFDDRFYRDPTEDERRKIGSIAGTGSGHGMSWTSKDWGDGLGYRTKVHFVPEGWKEVEVPQSDVRSFADFVEGWYGIKAVPFGQEPDKADKHKYGYATLDADGNIVQVIDRTNHNKKWDYWIVGGRYSDRLLLRNGNKADICLLGDWDFSLERDTRRAEAEVLYDKVADFLKGRTWKTWDQCREEFKDNIDLARREYHANPLIAEFDKEFRGEDIDEFAIPRDRYVQNAYNRFPFFAVLKDDVWQERGRMGYWAAVHDEMDRDDWNTIGWKILEESPKDAILTVVDCHI